MAEAGSPAILKAPSTVRERLIVEGDDQVWVRSRVLAVEFCDGRKVAMMSCPSETRLTR